MCSSGFQAPHGATLHHRQQSPDLWSRWTKRHAHEQSLSVSRSCRPACRGRFTETGRWCVASAFGSPQSARHFQIHRVVAVSALLSLVLLICLFPWCLPVWTLWAGWGLPGGESDVFVSSAVLSEDGGAVHMIRSASVVGGTAVSCGLRSWTCPRSGCSGDWGSPPAGTGEFTCSCLPSSLLLRALTCVGISIAVVPLVPTSVSHGANARFRISGCFPF